MGRAGCARSRRSRSSTRGAASRRKPATGLRCSATASPARPTNLGFWLADGGARDYRIGWRLKSAVEGDPDFEVNLNAIRREAANDDAEHGVMLRSPMRW